MIGLSIDYVWTWLKYRSRTLFRRKRKMRFPNGIPRVLTTDRRCGSPSPRSASLTREAQYVAQQMQLVEMGEITYDEFRMLMNNYGIEHG